MMKKKQGLKKASPKLMKDIDKYRISERNKRRHWRKKGKGKKDYSTVCVGVENYEQNIQACSHSFDIFKQGKKYVFPDCLKNRLSSLGTIGETQRGGCVLGFCAEPHAVKKIIDKLKRKAMSNKIERMVFTKAFRVRTGQIVDYCYFCQKTFRQLYLMGHEH